MTSVKKRTRSSKASVASIKQTYDVLVLATMSAGKSSFINALVGRELLPSANEATTACLTTIAHRKTARAFRGTCFSHTGDQIFTQSDASVDQVRTWNADAQVRHIRLAGKFRSSPSLAPGLVLHDTPGPNNSQDDRHGEMMLEAVRTVPFKLLCYVLNASQLGTWDDRRLLEQLRKLLGRRRNYQLVFVLNKVDLLDPERGESLSGCVATARQYLEGLGFVAPMIVPTMANIALYARKALNDDTLTRAERGKLRQSLDDLPFDEENTLDAAVLPDALRARVTRELNKAARTRQAPSGDLQPDEVAKLEQLIVRSGIKTVEFLLNQRSHAA
jgi:ribosome biogenesis GTPase A